jgi:hypothetical protein
LRTDPFSLEDMTVAADPDPYFALPMLYGAPAYGRAEKPVPETERPFDPDDLPIVAEQTEDERALIQMLPSGSYRSNGNGLQPPGTPHGSVVEASVATSAGAAAGVGARRFSLRALTDRLGPRAK